MKTAVRTWEELDNLADEMRERAITLARGKSETHQEELGRASMVQAFTELATLLRRDAYAIRSGRQ